LRCGNSSIFLPAIFAPEKRQPTDWQIYLQLASDWIPLRVYRPDKIQALWAKEPKGVVDDLLKSSNFNRPMRGQRLSIELLLEISRQWH